MLTKIITILATLATLAAQWLSPRERRAARRCKLADKREKLRSEQRAFQNERAVKILAGDFDGAAAANYESLRLSYEIYRLDGRIADLDDKS
ncbi:MAG TPA: hypothetical protein VLH56_11765 [Dissulfurispiraceae bacterium]|nr:hypothetical protein [Dissulfurispiraceae bacterium]